YIFGLFTLVIIGILTWLFILYGNIRFDINKIIDYKPPLTTQFFDKNGELVANIFQDEHRLYVKYDDIPSRIIEGLVAIEDTQFFEHNGINLDAISRAIIKDIKARKLVEGASTLTQQLVKNLVLTREKKLIRKVKEILLTLRLETILSKEEILERYLNQVYFGRGYYGIRTAALGYFKKELYELSLKEMTILVGLPRAPSFYDPTKNLKFALARGNQVVSRMYKLGWINKNEYDTAITEVPEVYKQTRTKNKAPYVIDYAIKLLNKNIKNLKTAGYRVDLTIDLKAQEISRNALNHSYKLIVQRDNKHFKSDKLLYIKARKKTAKLRKIIKDQKNLESSNYYKNGKLKKYWAELIKVPKELSYIKERTILDKKTNIKKTILVSSHVETLNAGIITIENNSGKIISIVGGLDYRKSSFNRVVQSKRQAGSSVKPFLYQKALDSGYSPATKLIDISRTYKYKKEGKETQWKPRNYEGNYKGFITLREALMHSRNLATINLVTDLGINVVYNGLKEYGINKIPRDLSITLGAFSMSPLEVAEAYSMFSNKGIQVKPFLIQSISTRDKVKTVFEKEEKYITSPEQIYLMTSILNDTVNKATGRNARVKNLDVAGKTGTTNDNIDAWFCGYTPSMQTIVWFGNDNNSPMGKRETGGRTAGPVFSYFYKNYLKIHPEIPRKFIKPDEVRVANINGKKEYYTDISILPEITIINENEQIEF
ncbi:MAG: PBP1A family penicillin-binding protein, partial [Campylobacteraceae bacterium]|nr:PBP1A family penicillin-binding protein [Campylobacteraceae bacterium]